MAWYSCAENDVSASKYKTLAIFLFNDGTFISTKHKISADGTIECVIEQSGSYTLKTAGEYKNNTGTATIGTETTTYTIENGTFTLTGGEDSFTLQSNSDIPDTTDPTDAGTVETPSTITLTGASNTTVNRVVLYKVSADLEGTLTSLTGSNADAFFSFLNSVGTSSWLATHNGTGMSLHPKVTVNADGSVSVGLPNTFEDENKVYLLALVEYGTTDSDSITNLTGYAFGYASPAPLSTTGQKYEIALQSCKIPCKVTFNDASGATLDTSYVALDSYTAPEISADVQTVITKAIGASSELTGYEIDSATAALGTVWNSYPTITVTCKKVATVSSTIDITTPTYSDVDIGFTTTKTDTGITFAVDSGYSSYTWIIDGTPVSGAAANTLTVLTAGYTAGSAHTVMVVADSKYSATASFVFSD